MTNTVIRRIIALGAISIAGLIAVQTYWVLLAWDLQQQEFERKVNQAMYNAANDLAALNHFTVPNESFVRQNSSNYWVVNVNNVFEAGDLEYVLEKAFQSQNLQEDYEYGIFDCSSDQMVTGKRVKANDPNREAIAEPLPKHYDNSFIYYFGVKFPGRTSNILSNMWIVLIFTVLMLVTIAFFAYAMFVITRQKQLSELQRDFINNMTHEFKTPISTIGISTEVFLQDDKIKSDQRLSRYASIIRDQTMRLNTQVEKVLQLAKVEKEKVELNYEKVDVADLLRTLSHSLELKVADKKGILEFDITAADGFIEADKLHLTNILHNLVDNGVKYSREVPHIRIGLKNMGNELTLSVQDNGIGIPKEHQQRVFDKFHRVPTGNVHDVKGFGLGLFYVKEICKQHRWKIDLESRPGEGTTIYIRMPQYSGE